MSAQGARAGNHEREAGQPAAPKILGQLPKATVKITGKITGTIHRRIDIDDARTFSFRTRSATNHNRLKTGGSMGKAATDRHWRRRRRPDRPQAHSTDPRRTRLRAGGHADVNANQVQRRTPTRAIFAIISACSTRPGPTPVIMPPRPTSSMPRFASIAPGGGVHILVEEAGHRHLDSAVALIA